MLQTETDTRKAIALDSDSKYIIILGPAYPLRGGLATYNQLLATKLTEEGHRVELLTFCLQYPRMLFPGQSQYSSDPPPEGLNISVEINSINPINWIKVGRKWKKQKPDLVILRYWMPFMAPALGTIARIIRRNKQSRIVAITDNIIPHERRPFDKLLTRYFVASCHGFVAMSRAVQADLTALRQDKPALFNPHPMYESFGAGVSREEACAKLGLKVEDHYLLFFGFIRAYKGLDLLLKSFALMNKSNVKLIVAGEYYDEQKKYEELIDNLGIRDRLLLRNDFIPNSEVRYYFSLADMVVQTYKTATQSGVTQIAYYYDVPMLVTDVGGLAELVPDEKVGYVVGQDPMQIASALANFYHQNRMEEFRGNIRLEKQRFTWSSMINRLLEAAELQ